MGEVNGGHKFFNLLSNAVKTKTAGAGEGKQIKPKADHHRALQSPNKIICGISKTLFVATQSSEK